MVDQRRGWRRQCEAFWRAHHEGWKRSHLNQRQYCEAHDLPLKAFGNWRSQFKAEPQPAAPKLLYRHSGLSHRPSHALSHSASHMTDDALSRPFVPPARNGHRRTFSTEDKRRILNETAQPGVGLSAVARRYGIAPRMLFRWKQELSTPMFVTVEIREEPPLEKRTR